MDTKITTTVKSIIEQKAAISKQYQEMYDVSDSEINADNYEDYCSVLCELDFLFNVGNVIQFADYTDEMTLEGLIDNLGEKGIVVVISPKTSNRCLEITKKYSNIDLSQAVSFGQSGTSCQRVIDLNQKHTLH